MPRATRASCGGPRWPARARRPIRRSRAGPPCGTGSSRKGWASSGGGFVKTPTRREAPEATGKLSFVTKSKSGTPDLLEVPDSIGGPWRTRTSDPLIWAPILLPKRSFHQYPLPEEVGSLLGACEQALLDDGVDAPVAVHHLRHAEVHRHGAQRDGLV